MLDSLFGPMGKENCVVFQIVSVFSFVMFITLLVLGVLHAKKNKSAMAIVGLVTSPLAMYYIYRLLYSMCIGAL
jgi:uncharacterized Tic20 family protein